MIIEMLLWMLEGIYHLFEKFQVNIVTKKKVIELLEL